MELDKKHELKGSARTKEVYLDGKVVDIEPSKCYHTHADVFDWGHTGTGPAQLALAIFLRLKCNIDYYQRFKFEVLAGLPKDQDFEITFNLGSPWTRKMAIMNVRAYDKTIDEELLQCKTNRELIAYVHPTVRLIFAESLGVKL